MEDIDKNAYIHRFLLFELHIQQLRELLKPSYHLPKKLFMKQTLLMLTVCSKVNSK